jgi:broad specificity phosphatase PhoE
MKQVWAFLVSLFITATAFSADASNQQLIVMRHGEAENNIKNVYNSDPDHLDYKPSNLTPKGEKEVKQTAKSLLGQGFNNNNISAVFVSPLPRTQQTADILVQQGLFSKDKIIIDKRLIELQAGDLEGRPIFHTWKQSYVKEYHTESEKHVQERVQDFYSSMLKQFPQGNIMIITHKTIGEDLIKIVTGETVDIGLGQAKVIPLPILQKSEP